MGILRGPSIGLTMKRLGASALPVVVVVMVVLALYRPLLPLSGPPKCSAKWDSIDFTYPYLLFASDCVRSGIVPFWNAFSFSGTPFWGNPQNQLLNPVSLAAALFPEFSRVEFQVLLVTQVLVGALGMYLWGAILTGSRAAGTCAAVTYAGGGMTVGFMSHYMQLSLMALLPYPFAFYQLWSDRGSRLGLALTSIFVTFWLVTTYPSQLGYQLCALGVFVVVSNVRRDGIALRVSWRRLLFSGLFVFGVPVLLASPHLLPVAMLLRGITRNPEPLQAAFVGSYHPVNLVSILAGGLASAPTTVGYPDITVRSLFVGTAAVIAAIYALSHATCGRLATLVAFLVCIDLSLGAHSRLFGLVHAVSPLSARSRYPIVDFAGLAFFAVSTLAILGYAEVLREGARQRRALAAVTAVVLLVLVGYWSARPYYPALASCDYQMRALVLPASGAVVWLLLAAGRAAVPSSVGAILLVLAVTWDTHWNVRTNEVLVCDTRADSEGVFARENEVERAYHGSCANLSAAWPRVNTYPTHSNQFIPARKRSNWGYDAVVTPLALRGATDPQLGKVLLNPTPLFMADFVEMSDRTTKSSPSHFIIDRVRGRATGDPLAASRRERQPRIVSWTANSLDVRVRTATPALLVVNEAAAPGWRAYVDGTEKAVITVNEAFRGVELPAGARDVRWVYWPPGLSLGLVLAALGFGLWVGLILSSPRFEAATRCAVG